MIPLVVLVGSFVLIRLLGWGGWTYLDHGYSALQLSLSLMFLLTASAHWGSRRADLVRMVPAFLPKREWIVTATGWLEIVGAAALMIPAFTKIASLGLILLLLAMFPANVYAARRKLTIGGRPVPGLFARTLMQIIFITALLIVLMG
ncbi:hypothetical protein SY83_11995 [Paenibacillus swuensis]|uniref:DoxX family protein n=1 Tax=Paenibacillus swuensis TaxID=1178515 RepID=A0A172TII9_9BACL|nr:DoxX family protein [Paenibacillus swuensis]ANE46879.1 hypothetical protein SY83_11995 [Paenibacillus swuensis]